MRDLEFALACDCLGLLFVFIDAADYQSCAILARERHYALEFIEALERANLRVAALVVNRVMAEMPEGAEIMPARISAALKKKLKRNLADFRALKTREESSLTALQKALPKEAVLMVAPDLGREPLTIADLAEVGRSLRPR